MVHNMDKIAWRNISKVIHACSLVFTSFVGDKANLCHMKIHIKYYVLYSIWEC